MIASTHTEKHRYIVAKYAPDIQRMEPRNIGIILWSHGTATARFLSPNEATFIHNKKTYKRWVKFWMKQIESGRLKSSRFESISVESPEFLDALIESQKGNYILLDGGILMDDIAEQEIDTACDFLFDRIVFNEEFYQLPPARRRSADAGRLATESSNAFKLVGLWDRPDFHKGKKGFNVPCRFNNVWKELKFHYAIGGANPDAVFHRIDLTLDSSWERAALRFEHLQNSKKLDRNRCGALIHIGSNGKPKPNDFEKNYEIINGYANMIDVADEARAADAIRGMTANL